MRDRAIRKKSDGRRFKKGGVVAYRPEDFLDQWLRRELGALYRGIIDEPLPPELAELVRLWQVKRGEKKWNFGGKTS